jgi:hypothetical protein
MKQSVASAGHVTVTVAGPATTTLLITSNGTAVDDVPESTMAAARTFAVPVSVVTVTTPRLVPPSCVKLRMTRKRLSETAIVREPPGAMVALWKDPAKTKIADAQKTAAIKHRMPLVFTPLKLVLFSSWRNHPFDHEFADRDAPPLLPRSPSTRSTCDLRPASMRATQLGIPPLSQKQPRHGSECVDQQ